MKAVSWQIVFGRPSCVSPCDIRYSVWLGNFIALKVVNYFILVSDKQVIILNS